MPPSQRTRDIEHVVAAPRTRTVSPVRPVRPASPQRPGSPTRMAPPAVRPANEVQAAAAMATACTTVPVMRQQSQPVTATQAAAPPPRSFQPVARVLRHSSSGSLPMPAVARPAAFAAAGTPPVVLHRPAGVNPVLLGSFSQRPDGMDVYAWPTPSKPHAAVFAAAKLPQRRAMQQATSTTSNPAVAGVVAPHIGSQVPVLTRGEGHRDCSQVPVVTFGVDDGSN